MIKKRLQTYIQENTPLLQQRHGLVTMLSMASQNKDKNGNYLIASEVTAIAEFLIIMDLKMMPPKSLLAQALPEYKRDDISTEQMKSLVVSLTADSLEVPKSPAKLVTKKSRLKKFDRGFTRICIRYRVMRTSPACPGHNKLSTIKVQL